MHPCGICGCSTRTAAITVGIIASLNYFLQLVVILLHRDFIVAEFSSDQYNVFVFNHFLLLLISLLMLIGGVKESKWALLPFICFVGFQDIISLIVALLSLSELLTSPLRNGVLGLFLVSLLNFLLVTWILWIVTRYFLLLHNGYSQFSVNDEVEVVIEAHYKKNDKIGDRDNEKIEDGNM